MFYSKSESEFPEWRKILEAHAAGTTGVGNVGSGGPRFDEHPDDGVERGDLVEETRDGDPSTAYEKEVIQSVWEFAEIVEGMDAVLWRKDEFGDWIYRPDYGNRHSRYGWEIFDPGVCGVSRTSQGVYAMRPMQWQSFIQQHEDLL